MRDQKLTPWSLCLLIAALVSLQILLFVLVASIGVSVIPGKTLFVIAHPDDEAMFFGPSILRSESPYILSISSGAPDGEKRTQELFRSCRVLGLEGSCFVDDDALPDGFEYDWEPKDVQRIVNKYVELIQPDRIVTFDSLGVSRHPNHIALARALRTRGQRVPEGRQVLPMNLTNQRYSNWTYNATVPVYSLRTGGVLSMYLGFYGTVLYVIESGSEMRRGFLAVTPLRDLWGGRIEQAFLEHKSQVIWYRYLWLWVSRFLSSNHLLPH